MSSDATTVVKITSPADILGVLPHRVGFHPSESIVVICLHGPRKRDHLVMRLDLAPPEQDAAVAADLTDRAARSGANAAVVVCYTEAADEAEAESGAPAPDGEPRLARRCLVESLVEQLRLRRIEVVEALLVRAGHWWSYHCDDPVCCPGSGTPLPAELTPAAGLYAAESVARGGVVLTDRAQLARSICPSRSPVAEAVRRQAGEAAVECLLEAGRQGGAEAMRALTLGTLRALVQRWGDGSRALTAEEATTVVLGLRDKRARDEVMTMALDPDQELLITLLVELARHAEDPDAAPVCTVLAWVAYAHGDGALVNVAVERALTCESGYEAAQLIQSGLAGMVPPKEIRRLTAVVRDDLRGGA